MPLKEILYKRKLKQSLRNVQKNNGVEVLNACKQVALLVEQDDSLREEQVEQFCKKWNQKGCKTSIFYLRSNKDKLEDEGIFTNTDFNWFGWPKADRVIDFINSPFDILIVLNPNSLKNIETLSILSKAKFKIGTNPKKLEHFHLIIDSKDHQDTKSVLKDLNHSIAKIAI